MESAIRSDAVRATRSLLTSVVARFAAAWETAQTPPELARFLPDAPEFRRLCLIELIKVDLEYRWVRFHHPKRLADYLAEYVELGAEPLPPDLVYEEFHALRRAGLEPEPSGRVDTDDTVPALAADDYRSTLIAVPWAQEALDGIEVGDRMGDFDLLSELGSGAFARVFLAWQRSMQRLVAVKISQNRGTESETLAQLDHDHIVRVYDQRLLADRDLKLLYMQYLPGGTLHDVLTLVRTRPPEERSGALLLEAVDAAMRARGDIVDGDSLIRTELAAATWPEAVAWLGKQLAESLDYAARHGVLHRDIKPANVLLTAEGAPKLADFNVSFGRHVAGTSPLAYFGGSLAYMSPEQLAACHPHLPTTAEHLDDRSDIYALGVMLWELLTGHRPFDDETRAGDSATSLERMLELRKREVAQQHLADLPPDTPPTLRRVLLGCLAPRPQDRWASGAELAQQLGLCLDRRARDLVDPPHTSPRARLGPWSLLAIVSLASTAGLILGVLYNNLHNAPLFYAWVRPDQRERLQDISGLLGVLTTPIAIVVTNYLCRRAFLVWRVVRRGRTVDTAILAQARRDTLVDGDRVALVAFGGWMFHALVTPVVLLVYSDLSVRQIIHFSTTLVVSGTIAVVYPFFLVTFCVVRCFYPRLLVHGETTDDSAALRALGRRCNRYLAVAASIPLIAVITGLMFLEPAEVSLVIDPIQWLCLAGILGFIGDYWLNHQLQEDLRAFERAVTRRTAARTTPATPHS